MATDPFVDRFSTHAVHARLDQIGKVVQSLLLKHSSQDVVLRLQRIADGIQLAQMRISVVDARWVGTGPLSQLEQHSQEILNQLNSFSGTQNMGHLKQANTSLDDGLLSEVRKLPVVENSEDALMSLSAAISKSRGKLLSELDEIRTEIAKAQAVAQQRTAEIADLRKKVTEQDSRVTKINERADAAIAAINKNAADSEQQREQRFVAFQKEQGTAADVGFQQRISAIETLLAQSRTTTAAALESLNGDLEKAKKILGAIGNTALTGDYRRAADSNEKTANDLRSNAVMALAAMVILIAFVVFSVGNGSVSWQAALFRLTAAISLAAIATYLARESSKHRAVGHRMRRLELELASIDAFTALVPDEQRQALKLELARKYFANETDTPQSTEMSAKDILKEIRACFRAFRK